jgi:hypothetical protein
MKKIALVTVLLVIAGGMIFFSSCKKDDTTAPVITLLGSNPLYLDLGDTWTDPGFTANDDKDGDITTSVVVTNTPNMAQVNHYTVTYTVEDKAGNATTETRDVYVKSDRLIGTYAAHDVVTGANAGEYDYNITVTQSSAAYNKLLLQNFGGFGAAVVANLNIVGTAVTIPTQTPAGMPAGYEGSIAGTGTYLGLALKTLNYTVNYTAGGSDAGVATLTKQ